MKIERDIDISKILRSKKQDDFMSSHTLSCGIWDDLGIESIFLHENWDSVGGLNRLTETLNSLDLRSRLNAHRNAEVFLKWVPNIELDSLNNIMKVGNFNLGKEKMQKFINA